MPRDAGPRRALLGLLLALPLGLLLLAVMLPGRQARLTARDAPLTIAAASDLQHAFEELGPAFERKTGQQVVFSFGATGTLVRQVENGAPFDALFAANEAFVERLDRGGHLAPGTRRRYATGRLVLASSRRAGQEVRELRDLLDPRIKRVAIANPEHAPYGVAAREALRQVGIWERLQPKLVLAENVRQALRFVQTGNAEAGLVSASVGEAPEVYRHPVPSHLHAPLVQAAAVIRESPRPAAARQFLDFVLSAEGQEALRRHGFRPPPGALSADGGERP